MATDDIARMHYFQRQYLGVKDFEIEQDYHRDMRRRHNLGHHSWGIVVGLELVKISKGDDENIYVCPGMAIDGFGREIVVMQPYELDPADYGTLPSSGNVDVWIGFDEERTRRPPAGYELCDLEEQFSRVRETFTIKLDPGTRTQDELIVDGKRVSKSDTTLFVDGAQVSASDPPASCNEFLPPDLSLPYQELPEDVSARWLIWLGKLYYDGSEFTRVVEIDASSDLQRIYVGNVTSTIMAPEGELVIRDRSTPKFEVDASGNLPQGVTTTVEGPLTVERLLTANKNLYVKGSAGIGTDNPNTPLHIFKGTDASLNDDSGYLLIGSTSALNIVMDNNEIQSRDSGTVSDLHLQAEGGDLILHQHQPTSKRLIVKDSGKVGIGTTSPDTPLHVQGGSDASLSNGTGYLVVGSIHGENMVLDGNEILARYNGAKSPLYLQAEGGGLVINHWQADAKVVITDVGRLGIGTANPKVKLHITGGSDASLTSGTGYLVIGQETGANLVLDDNEIIARSGGAESDLHFQAEGGDLVVHRWQAGSEFVVKDAGNVGVGTLNPADKLDVRGNIRLGSSGELYAIGGTQNCRVVAGRVSAAGAPIGGSGFSVLGRSVYSDRVTYRIRFTVSFSSRPIVVVSAGDPSDWEDNIANAHEIEVDEFKVSITDGGQSTNVGEASEFNFIAIGLR